MDPHINIIDNKEYYYVISYYTPSNDFLRNELFSDPVPHFNKYIFIKNNPQILELLEEIQTVSKKNNGSEITRMLTY